MNTLTTILYTLSSALLVPVIVLLVGLFGWSLLTLGDFFREALERRRTGTRKREAHKRHRDAFEAIIQTSGSETEATQRLDERLDDLERNLSGCLEKTDLACRVAPMLGLMGTLIPLGPALMALSGGDMQTLAKKLVVAFTTTVIGLATSAISLWVTTVRRRWYDADIQEMNWLANRLLDERKEEVDEPSHGKMEGARVFSEAAAS
ncbi:MAG: MotA/TolQ/ExbB proton channel family protein [Nitrospiria bacterium]